METTDKTNIGKTHKAEIHKDTNKKYFSDVLVLMKGEKEIREAIVQMYEKGIKKNRIEKMLEELQKELSFIEDNGHHFKED